MAEIICVIGSKGGTGKTTVSHMLGEGLGLLGQRPVVVLTDSDRTFLGRERRRYLMADARSDAALARVAGKLQGLDGWIGIIDGRGGHAERDAELGRWATLIVLPFRDSPEDMRSVARDLERFPNAMALPSQWPSNPWQREAAERLKRDRLAGFEDRIFDPVHAVSSSKLLLLEEPPKDLPAPLRKACRGLAEQALNWLEAARVLGRVPLGGAGAPPA
ncbi:MAG: hypothetical protein WCJ69_16255 [Betaproteobacteria bacterium]|jgi:hypothetical protein